ncbi:MAG TPA: flagellar basal body rod protein FlgB [Alphaproteobacteria bacterium]|nr:flagellar basal body rod protein FlgB [Alphaproteobacteria bacterium]
MPTVGDALKARMNYDIARQSVIAGNIANASTPGYLPADVSFKSYLQAATSGGSSLTQTNPMHMGGNKAAGGVGQLTYDKSFVQHNGNGVRMDQEMLKMQQNNLDYATVTSLYNSQAKLQKIALGRAQ